MKLEEAIEILEEVKELDDTMYAYSYDYIEALEIAISALKETQQYRKIGTVEEIKKAKACIKLLRRIKTLEGIMVECLEYEKIGTLEECREAVEKQKPKKPVLRNDNGKLRKSCPVCGCFFSPLSRSCPKCGQAILQENKDD